MSSSFYGSIGFSESLSVQDRHAKEQALEQLEKYFASHPVIGNHVKEAIVDFIHEAEGLDGYSTEEIIQAELPSAQLADLEKYGFKLYPLTQCR